MTDLTKMSAAPAASGALREPETLTMPEAAKLLSREERFMGTVHAMNTLLVHKGIYTQQEFDSLFCRWAKTQLGRNRSERPGWGPRIFARLFRR